MLSELDLGKEFNLFLAAVLSYFPTGEIGENRSASLEVLARIKYWAPSPEVYDEDDLVTASDLRELIEEVIQHQRDRWRAVCDALIQAQISSIKH
jgi:hypothetical protein